MYFPKWGLATGKDEIGKLFGDVGATLKSIVHHYSHFNWIITGTDTFACEGTSHGEHQDGPWRAGDPEWAAGRWCDVFEVRDWLIQRCFIYLDPDYAAQDTAPLPWLERGEVAPSTTRRIPAGWCSGLDGSSEVAAEVDRLGIRRLFLIADGQAKDLADEAAGQLGGEGRRPLARGIQHVPVELAERARAPSPPPTPTASSASAVARRPASPRRSP